MSALLLTACRPTSSTSTSDASAPAPDSETAAVEQPAITVDACAMILAPHQGEGKVDREIIRLQQRVRDEKDSGPWVERLGWMFVAKARESFDPGYYKLAEQCAVCMETHQAHSAEALLLRGHVLQNLHRFKEAEPLARELVAMRGLSFDYGLLGDTLMEQGRLDEAVDAYQKMVDQKPDMQAYARIANLRWLKGDLDGATQVMQAAVSAASPNAPESAAWVNTRLALFEYQNGDLSQASATCAAALDYQKDYAPALLLKGRMLLANGSESEAIETLQQAVRLNPLPEYQWLLSEALHASGQDEEAKSIEDELMRKGAAADPRTFALYLATSGNSPALAVELARNELNTRSDVFTHDALAWALAANGKPDEAWQEMQSALSEGTRDARLYLHATVIAAKSGHLEEAQPWLEKASGMMQSLLPSERKQLQGIAIELGQADVEETASTSAAQTPFTTEN